MLTYQKLISEKFFKELEQIAEKERRRARFHKSLQNFLMIGMVALSIVSVGILWVNAENWLPWVNEKLSAWGLSNLQILPW